MEFVDALKAIVTGLPETTSTTDRKIVLFDNTGTPVGIIPADMFKRSDYYYDITGDVDE